MIEAQPNARRNLLVLAVVVALVWGATALFDEEEAPAFQPMARTEVPAVGACYGVKGDPTASSVGEDEIEELACDEPGAHFRVLDVIDEITPDAPGLEDLTGGPREIHDECLRLGGHGSYETLSQFDDTRVSMVICGVLNVTAGDCLSSAGFYHPVDCDDTSVSGRQRILSMVDARSAKATHDPAVARRGCGRRAVQFLPFPSEKQIACLADVDA